MVTTFIKDPGYFRCKGAHRITVLFPRKIVRGMILRGFEEYMELFWNTLLKHILSGIQISSLSVILQPHQIWKVDAHYFASVPCFAGFLIHVYSAQEKKVNCPKGAKYTFHFEGGISTLNTHVTNLHQISV